MDATVNESGYTMTNTISPRNILSWLDNNAEKIFLFIGLLIIIHAIFFQTVYRYIVINVFSGDANSVVWTEELSRFIFVWITYLAIPIVIKTTKDIRVTIVYDFFNDFGKAVIANKDDEIKKSAKSLVMRAIAGVIIFFVPTLLNFVVELIGGEDNVYNGDFATCTHCMLEPTDDACRKLVD